MTERPRVATYEEVSPLAAPDVWDAAIAPYRTKTLFHETVWLRFLERSQRARVHGLTFLDDRGQTVGYFCAAEVRKGIFRLLGSPLQGWTTNAMGPIVDDVDPGTVLAAVDRFCRGRGFDYVEMTNPGLAVADMNAGGYELDADETFLVTVDSEPAMWGRLKSECRNRIRRGLGNGLRVERATDHAIVREYYGQLRDVFARHGLVPTYGEDRVQALWETLGPAGRLLALRVRHGEDVVATGLFPYDERAIYFWGGASWTRAYSLYPNELIHWTAMRFALERGIPTYNMSGGGSFKPKFGGRLVPTERWFRALSPFARVGRIALKRYVQARQRLLGRLKRRDGGTRPDRSAAADARGPS